MSLSVLSCSSDNFSSRGRNGLAVPCRPTSSLGSLPFAFVPHRSSTATGCEKDSRFKRLNRESFSQPVAVELRWGTKANGKDPNELVGLHGTANPLRPRDEKLSDEQLKTLKLIKEMNDVEPYSIYQLRKPYTMCVYKFTAGSGIAKKEKKAFLPKLTTGAEKKKIDMGTAADNAHVFCKALRNMGYEAYVFHSDSASCVCINGYEGRNDPKWVED